MADWFNLFGVEVRVFEVTQEPKYSRGISHFLSFSIKLHQFAAGFTHEFV
jgi:hypothetical protein